MNVPLERESAAKAIISFPSENVGHIFFLRDLGALKE